jgi:hypothetical protein
MVEGISDFSVQCASTGEYMRKRKGIEKRKSSIKLVNN